MSKKETLSKKHLHTIFTTAQTAILWQAIKYIRSNEYCVLDCEGGKYIKKPLKEWVSDIEFYKNQKLRKFTVSGASEAIRNLIKLGFVENQKRKDKKATYEIKEKELIKKLATSFPFLELSEKTSFLECEIDEEETGYEH